jgi:hypothetical protein
MRLGASDPIGVGSTDGGFDSVTPFPLRELHPQSSGSGRQIMRAPFGRRNRKKLVRMIGLACGQFFGQSRRSLNGYMARLRSLTLSSSVFVETWRITPHETPLCGTDLLA